MPIRLILLAFDGIRRRDELLQTEERKVLCKELGKIAPLGIIAGQQNGLAPKDIGVIFDIGVYSLLNIRILRVELIVLRRLRRT